MLELKDKISDAVKNNKEKINWMEQIFQLIKNL